RAHLKNFITPHVGRSRNFLSRTINIFTRSAGQGFESASGSRAPSWLSHDIKEVEVVDFRGQIEIRRKALATYNRDELRDQAVRAIARRFGARQADADRVMELAVREPGRGYDLDPQLPLGAAAPLVATRFWEEFRTHTENRHKRL